MAWWEGAITGKKYIPDPRQRRSTSVPTALTAAALNIKMLESSRTRITPANNTWQQELWGYYDTLGEFAISVMWRAYMISRVRLRAGKIKPGSDEPEILDDGPAADLVNEFAGGTVGQVPLMRKLSVLLDVPAEGWLVGETRDGRDHWKIFSSDEIKRKSQNEFQIIDENSSEGSIYWRSLNTNSMITRIWRPSDRYGYMARSPAFSARGAMRELELVSRHIVAQYLSRLASAGVVLFPDEITFPVRDEFMDAPDPFVREWIETAAEAIKTPGSASAVIPMPFRVPAEYVDKVKHVDFTIKLDDKIIEKRDSARKQLTTFLNVPTDLLFGAGDVNHWCKSRETRALTLGGEWRDGSQIQRGDTILTLDHVTGQARWSPVLDVYRADVASQEMLSIRAHNLHGGATFTFSATPEHRHPIIRSGRRIIVRGTELLPGDVLTRGAEAPAPETPTYTDDLVRLLAWYSADGTLTTQGDKPGQIRIGKSWKKNPSKTAKLIAVLTSIFGEPRTQMPTGIGPSWRMERHDNGMMIAVLNAAARDVVLGFVPDKRKVIPRTFVDKLTTAQREIFLRAWLNSDGSGSGSIKSDEHAGFIEQRISERLDAVEYAAILSGRAVRRTSATGTSGFGIHGVMYLLRISSQSHARVLNVTSTMYTGTIWCPVTETGTWLSREPDGWTEYTGNSLWQLEESAVRTYISGDVEMMVDGFTRGYLTPMLKAQRVPDAEQFVVWYDASELMVRPDKSQNAKDLYDRFELSGKALRREGGLDEDDAPTNEELEQIVLRKLVVMPQLAIPALKELTGLELEQPAPPEQVDPNVEPIAEAPEDAGDGEEPPADGPPDTLNNAPPEPDGGSRTEQRTELTRGLFEPRDAFAILQAKTRHIIKFSLAGFEILHPLLCQEKQFSCPYTHATWDGVSIHPGSPGTYECWLNTSGNFVIGTQVFVRDDELIPGGVQNGHARLRS